MAASKKRDADWQIGSTGTGRQGRVVLRITITDFPDEQRWSLAGRLVGRWAAELTSTWRERRRESDARRCVVELNDVTFIDQTGEAALAEIMSQGAELIASGLYTKQRLGDLRNECNLLIPNTRRGNLEIC